MKKYVAILAGILLTLMSGTAFGEMYMYMQDGVMVFTDRQQNNAINLSAYAEQEANRKNNSSVYYDHHIRDAAQKYDLDPKLLEAVIRVESNFDELAISKKGAMGLMQLMPQTASSLGVRDVFNPQANIDAGAKYLRRLLNKFNGDIRLALAAYNAGPTAVLEHGDIPPYRETRNYVKKVFSYYQGNPTAKQKKAKKKQSVYRVVLDDGTVLFTNDETIAKKASDY